MEMTFILFLLLVQLILTGCIVYLNIKVTRLKAENESLRIRESVQRNHVSDKQQAMIELIREKIHLREQAQVCRELRAAYSKEVASLQKHYPQLTEVDIEVLLLLGIGLENQEIIEFLDLSKRTYYKRRQTVAGRLGVSAVELNDFAMDLLGENNETKH